MKKIYEKPEAMHVVFDTEDILTVSTVLPEDEFDDDEGENTEKHSNGPIVI